MEGLWKLTDKGLAGFVKKLGEEIESTQNQKVVGRVDVGFCERNKRDQCYSLFWSYTNKHSGEIMISRRTYDSNELVIDRFIGITPVRSHSGSLVPSSPEELRDAAQIYDNVDVLLCEKFGEPASECNGRPLYITNLSQTPIPEKIS